jgi:hypothetical protein
VFVCDPVILLFRCRDVTDGFDTSMHQQQGEVSIHFFCCASESPECFPFIFRAWPSAGISLCSPLDDKSEDVHLV